MKVNADKCVFFKRKVVYLGHCLENGKLSVNPVKVEAILNARPPADVKELQSYMGLVNYFRKFVDSSESADQGEVVFVATEAPQTGEFSNSLS